jgi:3-oxoacyl-[acyl-carrier-protein] synthase II
MNGTVLKSHRRVVITGMGCISPIGNSVTEAWNNMVEGVSGIESITHFDASGYATTFAGEVKNFDAGQYFEAKDLKKVDLFSQFAVASATEAMESSGLTSVNFDRFRAGSVYGVGIGGLAILEKYHAALLAGGPRKVSPFLIPGMISNLAPGHIAIKYGLKGVNFTIQSACTSATHAIGESYRIIRSGYQDIMITGGAEAAITPTGIGGFCAMKALSTRNDAPQKASRPFDKDRDGFVMGEGSTTIILESLEHAEKRGATILAEIVGYGSSCDAYHITSPSVDGEGARRCMEDALADAGISASQIGYINAHGTSTPANDASETKAIKGVFGDWSKNGLLISSTKSMTGHLLGAAGAIEAMACVQVLNEGVIPPTINLEIPDEICDLNYVPNTAIKQPVEYALSNSFGFGGTNGTLILRRP